MSLAITNAERYRVLTGYHRDIFSAIEQRQLQRAIRLLFGFAEDYCLNFEGDVAALIEKYQDVIDAPADRNPDPSLFLQAFQQLWIAMEAQVIGEMPPDAVVEGADAFAAAVPRPDGAFGGPATLADLKKAILQRSSESSGPLVELRNVERVFGGSADAFKLGPVDLRLPRGQIVGVVGPNGSGKTTLLRVIAADLAPSSGNVVYGGMISHGAARNGRARGNWAAIRSKIAYVRPSQDPIHENTELALWITGAAHGIRPAELEQQVKVTMRKYALGQYSDRRVSELSTGYRLRFELARILFTDPSLLVLDEPLANLDRNAQITVLEDLKMLAASVDTPRSIVISSQHIEEIAAISDYLVYLSDGRVQFSGRREEVPDALDYALFEVGVSERWDELERLLLALGAVELDRTPIWVRALFRKGTEPERLLTGIGSAGLRLVSFRDLSGSIEALLLMPRFRAGRQAGGGAGERGER